MGPALLEVPRVRPAGEDRERVAGSQPIYSSSVERRPPLWRQLNPLIEALGYSGSRSGFGGPQPAPVEKD